MLRFLQVLSVAVFISVCSSVLAFNEWHPVLVDEAQPAKPPPTLPPTTATVLTGDTQRWVDCISKCWRSAGPTGTPMDQCIAKCSSQLPASKTARKLKTPSGAAITVIRTGPRSVVIPPTPDAPTVGVVLSDLPTTQELNIGEVVDWLKDLGKKAWEGIKGGEGGIKIQGGCVSAGGNITIGGGATISCTIVIQQ